MSLLVSSWLEVEGGVCVLEVVGGRCACGKVWGVGVLVEKCGG